MNAPLKPETAASTWMTPAASMLFVGFANPAKRDERRGALALAEGRKRRRNQR